MYKASVKLIFFVCWIYPAYSHPAPVQEEHDKLIELEKQARRILEDVPLVDGHNDFPWNVQTDFDGQLALFDMESNMCDQFVKHVNECHTDIPRLSEGMVGAQFWSVYTRCNTQYKDGAERALELIDLIKRFTRKYDYFFKMAYSAQDIIDAHEEGKVASLIGIEGGHMIQNSLGVLRMMYTAGVRYLTLTWNCNTPWADNSDPEGDELTPPNDGLSEWGKLLIKEMNRLGMLVDLSHVSYETMLDSLEASMAPVIFSHSSVYAICPHRRNVPDDVLLKLRDNRGVIMINFYNKFLNCTEDNRYIDGYRSSDIHQIVDHMEYVRELIGVDYIGLGSDFDGMSYEPHGMEDTSKYPNLVTEMLARNWTEEEIKKVVSLNILRVLSAAEQVRDQQSDFVADETLIDYSTIPDLSCKNLPDWDADYYVEDESGLPE